MDLRNFGPYNIFLVTDRSIYCHMTLNVVNYLLYIYRENTIWLFPYHIPYQPETPISSGELSPYHIMLIIYMYFNMRKSCSVLWTFSHVINIILKVMLKGWWYRYQLRQTNTVVMFFQYYICKFPLFSTKYMISIINIYVLKVKIYYFITQMSI